MRISDMELREVAARLRSYIPDRSGMISTAEAIGAFDADTIGNRVFFDDVLRIADLIDRTCEMKSIPKSSYRVCSRCGAFVRRDAVTNCTEVIPVMRCPNCGARVVRNDE